MSTHFLCIAHRGGPGPENSLAAVDAALALGVDGIELDVWHFHGELWVTHDSRLGRQLPGSGPLAALSHGELDRLRLENAEPIPKLAPILERVAGRCLLNLEIKNPGTAPVLARALSQYQNATGAGLDHLLISSFYHSELADCRQRLPHIRRGALLAGIPLDGAACAEAVAPYSFHSHVDCTTAELAADVHRRGMQHYVYTANWEDQWEGLMDMGVDGVFTDRPEALLQHRASAGGA